MAAAPTMKATAMTGMRRARPPISDSLVSPVVWTIAPAQRKSRALNRAWLTRWYIAPATPSGVAGGEADREHAHLRDGVVGEQALEVVLGQRDSAPRHDGRDRPDDQ